MDNHAVPRQITTFEFKLIGFFTVKQFIYLLVFAGITVVVFYAIPVPGLNILLAVAVGILGLALVFYKRNERPLDVWLKNLFVSLMSPSQYRFMKNNMPPAFLMGVYATPDENIIQTHIDAREKLSNYMAKGGQPVSTAPSTEDAQKITTLFHATPLPVDQNVAPGPTLTQAKPVDQPTQPQQAPTNPAAPHPFLSGVVRNSKEEPLPNVMVYINSDSGQVMRILKTNHSGIFATFHPLPSGSFVVSPKDLGGSYFFDTMNIAIQGPQKDPLQIYSKELL